MRGKNEVLYTKGGTLPKERERRLIIMNNQVDYKKTLGKELLILEILILFNSISSIISLIK